RAAGRVLLVRQNVDQMFVPQCSSTLSLTAKALGDIVERRRFDVLRIRGEEFDSHLTPALTVYCLPDHADSSGPQLAPQHVLMACCSELESDLWLTQSTCESMSHASILHLTG